MPFIFALILTLVTIISRPDLLPKPNFPTPTPIVLKVSITPMPDTKWQMVNNSDPWGTAIQTGTHTYKIKVQNDTSMGSPDEILSALNELRRRHGAQTLVTDPLLCSYAQSRADYFNSIHNIDSHAGFEKFLESEDGFNKLGFRQVGENSSYGYVMSGVHLIEFVYMQSPTHNKNQLDPKWDHACVGTSGAATNLIFATSPI